MTWVWDADAKTLTAVDPSEWCRDVMATNVRVAEFGPIDPSLPLRRYWHRHEVMCYGGRHWIYALSSDPQSLDPALDALTLVEGGRPRS